MVRLLVFGEVRSCGGGRGWWHNILASDFEVRGEHCWCAYERGRFPEKLPASQGDSSLLPAEGVVPSLILNVDEISILRVGRFLVCYDHYSWPRE